VPISADSAVFPPLSADADKDVDGSDQSAILLVNLNVEGGCFVNFGSRLAPLHVDADYFTAEGAGSAWWTLDNSTECRIFRALSTASDGGLGFNLDGTGNALLLIDCGNGTVGVAYGATQAAEFTTIQIQSGNVFLGDAITCTTLHVTGGTVENGSNVTTLNVMGGNVTQEKNIPTNLNQYGGRYYLKSTDTITAGVLYAGILDLSKDARAKTFTDLTVHPGASIYDPGKTLVTTNAIVWAKGGTISLT
jgi:hypothetical protein